MRKVLFALALSFALVSCKEPDKSHLQKAKIFSADSQILMTAISELCEEQSVCTSGSSYRGSLSSDSLDKVQKIKDRLSTCEFYFEENSTERVKISVKNCAIEYQSDLQSISNSTGFKQRTKVEIKVLDPAIIVDATSIDSLVSGANGSLAESGNISDSETSGSFTGHSLVEGEVVGTVNIKGHLDGNIYEGNYDLLYKFPSFTLHGRGLQKEKINPSEIISGKYSINEFNVDRVTFVSTFGMIMR